MLIFPKVHEIKIDLNSALLGQESLDEFDKNEGTLNSLRTNLDKVKSIEEQV